MALVQIDDVARSVLAAIDSDAGVELAAKWISERYAEMVGKVRFRHLRRTFSLFVPANYTAGTVTVTTGSKTVTGVGTAWDQTFVDRYFRFSIVWYRIAAVDPNSQTLTLENPVSESTVTLVPPPPNATYFIVQRYLTMPPDIRWVGEVTHPRLRCRLRNVSMSDLTYLAPSRQRVGPYPSYWAEGVNSREGFKQIEVYPPSNLPETYDVYGWPIPPPQELRDVVPPEIDSFVLREGALADLYRYNASRAMNKEPPDIQAAEAWDKRFVDQLQIWDGKIKEAAETDRGADDVSVVVYPYDDDGRGGWSDFDSIQTAREWVWSRLNWP
jgi:hypothetical protein